MTVSLRTPTLADAEAAAALMNEHAVRHTGRPDITPRQVRGWWTQPAPFELSADVIVAEEDGAMVGYGDIGDPAHDGSVFWLDVRGDAYATVIAELEERVARRAAPGGVVRAVAYVAETGYRDVLAERGYERVRLSYRMAIDFDGALEPPDWPPGASVRVVREGEEPLLHTTVEEAFRDSWGFVPQSFADFVHGLRELGAADPALLFVAEIEGETAGVAICRPEAEGDPTLGWVSTLGVLPPFRRRGLARALLRHTFGEFAARGLRGAMLGVDAENPTGAVELYERAGMHVAFVMEIWERPL